MRPNPALSGPAPICRPRSGFKRDAGERRGPVMCCGYGLSARRGVLWASKLFPRPGSAISRWPRCGAGGYWGSGCCCCPSFPWLSLAGGTAAAWTRGCGEKQQWQRPSKDPTATAELWQGTGQGLAPGTPGRAGKRGDPQPSAISDAVCPTQGPPACSPPPPPAPAKGREASVPTAGTWCTSWSPEPGATAPGKVGAPHPPRNGSEPPQPSNPLPTPTWSTALGRHGAFKNSVAPIPHHVTPPGTTTPPGGGRCCGRAGSRQARRLWRAR